MDQELENEKSLSMLSITNELILSTDNIVTELSDETDNVIYLKSDWKFTQEIHESDLEYFLSNYSHKMTSSHGHQTVKCTIHLDRSKHQQIYGYIRCSSMKCFQVEEDSCSFIFKV